ncbi:MAG: hypothetical protein ACRD1M_15610 [Terriglobales bacterium]
MRSKLNLLATAAALAAMLVLGGAPLMAAPPQPAPAAVMMYSKHKKHKKAKKHKKHKKSNKSSNKG